MVVCAVVCEPVSALQFPANREINREFYDFGAFRSEIGTESPRAAAISY
jgi:hypothetical protein